MTGGTIHTVHEHDSNVVSGITNDRSISETTRILSVIDRKRKAEEIYLS